jgi:acyl-CoA synthetase (AMP-forming)/AMP-acid ligase II
VFTPYGATEALPVASIGSDELLSLPEHGICVGRPVPGVDVALVRVTDEPMAAMSDDLLVGPGEVGEVVVRGPVVSPAYADRPEATAAAKLDWDGRTAHRMGDLASWDDEGRLWFAGRKAHVVHTAAGPMHSVPCEEVFNLHPAVRRSALVGVGPPGAPSRCSACSSRPARTRPRRSPPSCSPSAPPTRAPPPSAGSSTRTTSPWTSATTARSTAPARALGDGAAVRVLVTGGGGFLGGAVVRALLARGDDVVSVARGDYPALRELGVHTVRGDLADTAWPGRSRRLRRGRARRGAGRHRRHRRAVRAQQHRRDAQRAHRLPLAGHRAARPHQHAQRGPRRQRHRGG